MTEKKTLSAKEVVEDLNAGATDEFLMKKYGLSEKGLQTLFKKLITAKVLTEDDLDRRASTLPEVEEVHEVRVQKQSAKATGDGEKSDQIMKSIHSETSVPLTSAEQSKRISVLDQAQNDLIGAARNRHFKRIQELVEQGADINGTDEEGNTPLMVACSEGHFQAVKYLIEKGADLTLKNKAGADALQAAKTEGQEEIIKIIGKHLSTSGSVSESRIGSAHGLKEPTDGLTELKDWIGHPWYENSVLLILLTFLCFPVSAYGLYHNTKLSRKTKMIAVGVFCVIAIFGTYLRSKEEQILQKQQEEQRIAQEQEISRKDVSITVKLISSTPLKTAAHEVAEAIWEGARKYNRAESLVAKIVMSSLMLQDKYGKPLSSDLRMGEIRLGKEELNEIRKYERAGAYASNDVQEMAYMVQIRNMEYSPLLK